MPVTPKVLCVMMVLKYSHFNTIPFDYIFYMRHTPVTGLLTLLIVLLLLLTCYELQIKIMLDLFDVNSLRSLIYNSYIVLKMNIQSSCIPSNRRVVPYSYANSLRNLGYFFFLLYIVSNMNKFEIMIP